MGTELNETEMAELEELRAEAAAGHAADYRELVLSLARGEEPDDQQAEAIMASARKTMDDLARDVGLIAEMHRGIVRSGERCARMMALAMAAANDD
jgi:hypothetical protein